VAMWSLRLLLKFAATRIQVLMVAMGVMGLNMLVGVNYNCEDGFESGRREKNRYQVQRWGLYTQGQSRILRRRQIKLLREIWRSPCMVLIMNFVYIGEVAANAVYIDVMMFMFIRCSPYRHRTPRSLLVNIMVNETLGLRQVRKRTFTMKKRTITNRRMRATG